MPRRNANVTVRISVLIQFTSVQLLIRVQLFATPWTAARQESQSITNSWSLLKLKSIESVVPQIFKEIKYEDKIRMQESIENNEMD